MTAPSETRARRRKYAREYARRKRDREMEKRRSGEVYCPRKFGRFGICGAKLEHVTDGNGGVRVVCPACERMRRGICADCARPVDGKVGYARRCAEHKKKASRRSIRASENRHREERRARSRKYYNNNPDIRERRNEYKRLWRAANPDKVAQQKRREALRQSPKRAKYHERYRRHRRKERAARELDRYHGQQEPRLCPTCGVTVLSGKARKCEPCKAAARELAREQLDRYHAGRGRRTDLERGVLVEVLT